MRISEQTETLNRSSWSTLPAEIVPLVIGVTGHRDLVEEEIPGLRTRVRALLEQLRADYPDLPLVVMSPLAEGADRLVAEEARALGIPLSVPLPFPVSIYEHDFKAPGSLEQFRDLCADAQVVELPLLPGDTPETIAEYGHRRDAHYARLGIYLCAHCHILLAIWDGKESDKLGGTAQVVHFHHRDEMPGFVKRSETSPHILAEDESDLVWHLVCSRNRSDGAPAEGFVPLETFWYTNDAQQPRTRRMPAAYRGIFTRTAEFNRDVLRFLERIRSEGWPLLTENAPQEITRVAGPVNAMFKAADTLAIHFQARFMTAMRVLYTIAALMGLTVVAYPSVPWLEFLAFVFLGLFITGAVIYQVAERGGWHRKYLDYRALAEGLRVQFYWVASGVTAGRTTKFAHDNFLQKQDVELGWIRNVMRWTGRTGNISQGTRAGLEYVTREWVGTPHSETGQLAYYQHKSRERMGLNRRTHAISMVCMWSGIALGVALVIYARQMSRHWEDLLIMFMGVLPMIAAVREAYAQKRAERELIKQYLFMGRIFGNACRRLEMAESDAVRRHILKALGDAALEEHAQWLLIHRERPLEHGLKA
ncbi:MAG: hypothetical protein ACNA7E_00130 [Wenzhouxiangellaceae bacterium]